MNTNRTTRQRLFFMAVWCSVVVPLAFTQAKPNYRVSSHSTQKDPDVFIHQLMKQAGAPGIQAVVGKDGKIVWSGSFGNAVLDVPDLPRPMRNDALALIASTSKILVAIATLQQDFHTSTSADQIEKLKLPGPDVQNQLLGSWSILAEGSFDEEGLASGRGTELWYPGPGGQSLIEEFHITNREGRPIDAFGPAWWDQIANGQRFLWCANNLPDGCVVSENVMRWEGDRYIYREDRKMNGQKTRHEEVFSDVTEQSFLQTLLSGPLGENPTSTWIAHATKLQADLPRMAFSAAPIAASLHRDINKLLRALSGSWEIQLSFAPNEKMPKGGSGMGEETFHAGPGGLSVIEEYHSTGDEGEVSGLGVCWPDKQPSTMRALWCDSTNPNGCAVMSHGARWEGNRVVIEDEPKVDGKKVVFKEVFSNIKENSFTQTIYQGESKGTLKPFATITATRKTPQAQ